MRQVSVRSGSDLMARWGVALRNQDSVFQQSILNEVLEAFQRGQTLFDYSKGGHDYILPPLYLAEKLRNAANDANDEKAVEQAQALVDLLNEGGAEAQAIALLDVYHGR